MSDAFLPNTKPSLFPCQPSHTLKSTAKSLENNLCSQFNDYRDQGYPTIVVPDSCITLFEDGYLYHLGNIPSPRYCTYPLVKRTFTRNKRNFPNSDAGIVALKCSL